MKVSDLIAEYLEKAEIKVIFGIIGSANSHIFDSISKRGYTEIVCVHHEQAAVMAMGAYFRASGRLSAALVTAGAGAANAITGIMSNWADSIPGIIISGQEQAKFLEQYRGMRMFGIQGFDSPAMAKKITKYSKTITLESEVQSEFEMAHSITQSGRPGPVLIDVPFDVQARMVESREWNLKVQTPEVQFDGFPVLLNRDIDHLLKLLSEAKRPIIIAGHGVRLSGTKKEFQELVGKLQIPTILSWSGIDLLHDTHPFYFGRSGVSGMRHSNFIVQNSDFILVIGTRLSLLQTGYDIKQFAPHAKIFVIDVDNPEWKKHPPEKYERIVDFGCKVVLPELNKRVTTCNVPEWIQYCNKVKAKYPLIEASHKDGGENYLNSYRFLDKLSDYIDDDAIIVTDMGTGLLSGHYSIRLKPNQLMFTSLGLGEMGYGLPGAIGAAKAFPNRQIVCLNCDGGMMMNLQELQTIIHHKMNIKLIVFNNDGYLMIKHTQNLLFKGYRTGVDTNTGVSLPNYKKVGNSFGFRTWELSKWNDFARTIIEWSDGNDPTLLEVFMDPNQDFIPKVKGVANEDGTISPASLEEMSPLLPYSEIEEFMIAGVNPKSKAIKR